MPKWDVSLFIIYPRDAVAQATGNFIRNSPSQLSQFLGAHGFTFLPADQNHFLAGLNTPDMGYIHHHLIHTNPAGNPRPFPANQAIRLIRKTAGIAVAVTYGQSGDLHFSFSDIGMAIADT